MLPSEAFDARAVLHSVEQDKPTALYGVPTMFLAELELLSQGSVRIKIIHWTELTYDSASLKLRTSHTFALGS